MINTKKTLPELEAELKQIIIDNPEQIKMLEAVFKAGYTPKYMYVKYNAGMLTEQHLKKKQVYRIQISYTEKKKAYPAAWIINIPCSELDWYVDYRFDDSANLFTIERIYRVDS